jgi:hypothetical protein
MVDQMRKVRRMAPAVPETFLRARAHGPHASFERPHVAHTIACPQHRKPAWHSQPRTLPPPSRHSPPAPVTSPHYSVSDRCSPPLQLGRGLSTRLLHADFPTPHCDASTNVGTPTCPLPWPWLSRLSLSTLFPEKNSSISSATIPSFRSTTTICSPELGALFDCGARRLSPSITAPPFEFNPRFSPAVARIAHLPTPKRLPSAIPAHPAEYHGVPNCSLGGASAPEAIIRKGAHTRILGGARLLILLGRGLCHQAFDTQRAREQDEAARCDSTQPRASADRALSTRQRRGPKIARRESRKDPGERQSW